MEFSSTSASLMMVLLNLPSRTVSSVLSSRRCGEGHWDPKKKGALLLEENGEVVALHGGELVAVRC